MNRHPAVTQEFELRHLEHFGTRAQARAEVAAWIEEYHHDRHHFWLGMLSFVVYEQALTASEEAT